jgi:hypothetical protein
MSDNALHPSIVALVSLAANIAANHPRQGLCQLERLRGYGIGEEQIALVVDIARHIRDEAGQMLDHGFDEKAAMVAGAAVAATATVPPAPTFAAAPKAACCTPTAKGNACC